MATKYKIKSKSPLHKCGTYKIAMMVEFYKEMIVRAACESEAKELVETRLRNRQSMMVKNGYSIGDIEILEAVEYE